MCANSLPELVLDMLDAKDDESVEESVHGSEFKSRKMQKTCVKMKMKAKKSNRKHA